MKIQKKNNKFSGLLAFEILSKFAHFGKCEYQSSGVFSKKKTFRSGIREKLSCWLLIFSLIRNVEDVIKWADFDDEISKIFWSDIIIYRTSKTMLPVPSKNDVKSSQRPVAIDSAAHGPKRSKTGLHVLLHRLYILSGSSSSGICTSPQFLMSSNPTFARLGKIQLYLELKMNILVTVSYCALEVISGENCDWCRWYLPTTYKLDASFPLDPETFLPSPEEHLMLKDSERW